MYKLLYNSPKKVYCVRKNRPHFSDKCRHLVVQGCFDHLTQISENLNKGLPKIRLTKFYQNTKHKQSEIPYVDERLMSPKDNVRLNRNFREVFIELERCDVKDDDSLKKHSSCDLNTSTEIIDSQFVNKLSVHVQPNTGDMNKVSSSFKDNSKPDINFEAVTNPLEQCYYSIKGLKNNIDFEADNVLKKDFLENDTFPQIVTNDTELTNITVTNKSSEYMQIEVDDDSKLSLSIEDNLKTGTNLETVTISSPKCEDRENDSKNEINFKANTVLTKEDDDLQNYVLPYIDINDIKITDTKLNNFDTIMERELERDVEDNQLRLHEFTQHENNLIDIAFLPTEPVDIEKIYSAEQDILSFKTNYMISDRLEKILSATFDSDGVELIRHNDSDTDNFSLSPIALRSHEKYPIINDSSYTSKSHEITIEPSSFLSTHEQSRHIDDVNDETFDPSDSKHCSTISIESHKEPNSTNNDLDQPSSEIQEVDGTNKTSNSVDGMPPNPNIENNGCSSKLLFTQKGSCDNTALKVQIFDNTPRWTKKYACPLCKASVCKLPRHMETVHSKSDTAKKLKTANTDSDERKQILNIMRNDGSFKHNTDPNYNNGTLYVTRRPRFERPATDYTTCPNCYKTLVKSNAKKHISKCSPCEIGGSRVYLVLGRTVEGRLHKTASATLQLVVFPVLREDEIVRLIRYDWLIILYGNKLCLKYTPHYQHNMIRARLRLIGRFLHAAKGINKDIHELADIYNPKNVATVVDAIKVVAKINHLKNTCETPAVALNLVTHIKQIAHLLETEYVIKENKDGQEKVINFLKVYSTEMPISINKIAMEADAKAKRQKVIVLPMTEDINKLIIYLKNERKQCFCNLSTKFDLSEWLKSIKLVAVYLLVFNRRRVGEIQNILLSDYEHLENIDISADKEEFEALDAEGKEIAMKYKRIKIRGKRGRIVSVIMSIDVIEELNLLLKYRQNARIPHENEYLFGLPSTITERINVVQLYVEMPKVSVLCGATKPKLLRGTGLRKHIATKCIELELKDTEVAGVAGHLGHSEKIHHEHYRLPPKSRTIVQITKVLQAVQGDLDEDDSDNENNNLNNQEEFVDCENEGSNELPSITEEEASFESPESSTPNTSLSFQKKQVGNPLNDEMIGKSAKKRWSESEKQVVLTAFSRCFQERTLPTLKEIDELKKRNPCLQNRPRQSIKTWISNQYKIPPTQTKNRPRIVSCEKVNFTLKRKFRDDEAN